MYEALEAGSDIDARFSAAERSKVEAIKDKIYIEQKTGKAYSGGQLIQGIEIMSAQGENSAMTLYFKTK